MSDRPFDDRPDDRPLGAFPQPFRRIVWPRGVRTAEPETAQAVRIARLQAQVARTLFRGGCDTVDIARVLHIGESEAARLVRMGREAR